MGKLAVLAATFRSHFAEFNIFVIALGLAALFPSWEALFVYPRFESVLVRFTEDDAVRLTRHLSASLLKAPDLLHAERLTDDVIAEVTTAMQDFGVAEIKVFSASGLVLWASDAAKIGERNTHVYFRDIVAQGQPFSKLARKATESQEGQIVARDVVESYAPIMVDGRFQGAFEVYADVTGRLAVLADARWRTLLFVGALAVVLIALVMVALWRTMMAARARDIAFASLRDSENRFRSMAASAQDAIIEMDDTGRIAFWNPAAERIFGHTMEQALGRDLHQLIAPPRFLPSFTAAYPRFLSNGEGSFIGRLVEMVALRRDGTEVPVEFSIAALGGRHHGHAMGILRDITARKEVEQRLKLGARVMDHAMNGIIVTDAELRIQAVNPAFTRLTGYSLKDVAGKTPAVLKSGRHGPDFYGAMWSDLKANGEWQGEIWNRRKTGEVFPEWLCLTTVADNHGRVTHYVAIFSDITQRKEAERDLERLAFYDPLTGIANRVLFRERVSQSVKEAQRYGGVHVVVFYLDLDRFKQVNDSWGHHIGDLLLQQVARRLEGLVRQVDTVARLGGDEFAILARSIPDETAAAAISPKVPPSLAEPFHRDGHLCHIGSSIGIALFPDHAENAEQLVHHADEAMYRAKRGGRNQYQIYRDLHEDAEVEPLEV